jgi:hypothetical protein
MAVAVYRQYRSEHISVDLFAMAVRSWFDEKVHISAS